MHANGRPSQGKRLTTPPSKPGTLHALQLKLWRGVVRAEAILDHTEYNEASIEVQLRALNSFSQCCLAYLASIKAADYAVHPAGDPR
jgi:hypothetical protein